MSKTIEGGSRGMGFLSWLTIAFVVLKLTGYIGWSWWWVLAPLWIPWAVVGSCLIGIGAIYLVAITVASWERRHRRKIAREARRRFIGKQ